MRAVRSKAPWIALMMTTATLLVGPVSAASVADRVSTVTLIPAISDNPDLAAYMTAFGVDSRTASEQLAVQEALSTVDPALQISGFAGFEIIREGGFRVVMHTAAPVSSAMIETLRDRGILRHVQFVLEDASLSEMVEYQRAVAEASNGIATSMVDVSKNVLVVNYPNPTAREKIDAKLTPKARNNVVYADETVVAAPAVGGGDAMTTCTAGFIVVKTSTGNRGISTAGHCPNTQSYKGSVLNFKTESYGGANDIQWHDSGQLTWNNTVSDGVADGTPYFRYITARAATSSISRGNFYCKTGKETGYDCGTVGAVNYCPSYGGLSCDFFLLGNGSANMAIPGDSGGPVYTGGTAVGTISGYYGTAGSYSAIVGPQATFANLGLAVAIN